MEATFKVTGLESRLTKKGKKEWKISTDGNKTFHMLQEKGEIELGKEYRVAYDELEGEFEGKKFVSKWIQAILLPGATVSAHNTASGAGNHTKVVDVVKSAEQIFGNSKPIDKNQILIDFLKCFEQLHKSFHEKE